VTTLFYAKGLLEHLVLDFVAACENLDRPMPTPEPDHARAEWVSSYEQFQEDSM
jgi:hypothetical protein